MFEDFSFEPVDDSSDLSNASGGSLGNNSSGNSFDNWSTQNANERINSLNDFITNNNGLNPYDIQFGSPTDGQIIQFDGSRLIIDEQQLMGCDDPSVYLNSIAEGVNVSDETDNPDATPDENSEVGRSSISFGSVALCQTMCNKDPNEISDSYYKVL